MPATIAQIYQALDEMAPFETQESWDNAGLLAGHPQKRVEKVLVALDPTLGAVEEAVRLGAQLLITHHPILFHARKNLREDDPEGALLCALVRANLGLICAHTNFDVAEGGVNDALAEALGLTGARVLDKGLRAGHWGGTLGELAQRAQSALGGVTRLYGDGARRIGQVAVCGGAGGSFWRAAREAGAEALLTGEVRHSDALDAMAWGMALIEAGHYQTERVSLKAMRTGLQNRLDALQYRVVIVESGFEPF